MKNVIFTIALILFSFGAFASNSEMENIPQENSEVSPFEVYVYDVATGEMEEIEDGSDTAWVWVLYPDGSAELTILSPDNETVYTAP